MRKMFAGSELAACRLPGRSSSMFRTCVFAAFLAAFFSPLMAQTADLQDQTADIQDTVRFPDAAPPAGDMQSPVTLEARIAAIDETLALLNRRLEMIPMGQGLPGDTMAGDLTVDSQELLGRLESIENRLSALASLPGEPSANPSADMPAIADLRVRLTQIEEIMRSLNGKLDDVSFRLNKFSERFEQVSADSEFRFQQLELAAARAGSAAQQNPSSESQVLGTLPVSKPEAVELLAKAETVTLIGETSPETRMTAPGAGAAQAPSAGGTPKEIYESALKKLQMGAYQEAQAELQNFLDMHPTDRLAGNAQYWLGETFYVQRDYKNATAAFLAGYTNYGDSIKAPDSLLKLGMTLIVMGEKKTGCDAFAELSARFPDASETIARRAEIESQRAACSG